MRDRKRPESWEEFTGIILARYGPAQRARATWRVTRQAMRELAAHVEGLDQFDEEAITDFVEAQPPARSVARTVALLRCLRAASRYALRRKWIDAYPFEERGVTGWMRADSKPRKPKLVMTGDQVYRWLAELDSRAAGGGWRDGRAQALGYIYAYTGFRRNEGTHCLRRNFDRQARTLTIEPYEGWRPKTVPSARIVPLHRDAFDVLDGWEPRCGSEFLTPGHRLKSPWKGGPGYRPIDVFREAAAAVGIAEFSIIAVRRGLASLTPAFGIDREFRRQLMGHTDPETAERWYIQEQTELLRTAVDRIHYGPAPPPVPPAPRRAAGGGGR